MRDGNNQEIFAFIEKSITVSLRRKKCSLGIVLDEFTPQKL